MPLRRLTPRVRSRAALAAAISGVAAVAAAAAALAAASKSVSISDASGDASGELDMTRISFQRASDGRLRAVVTFSARITPRTFLAQSGPPGSACLRIWTAEDADPRAMRPDRLVCVTARSRSALRGGVYEVRGAELPRRVGGASVKRASSGRTVVVRFSQSSIARPRRIRFAMESTRPGCERTNCIDTVPDRGATRAFRLR